MFRSFVRTTPRVMRLALVWAAMPLVLTNGWPVFACNCSEPAEFRAASNIGSANLAAASSCCFAKASQTSVSDRVCCQRNGGMRPAACLSRSCCGEGLAAIVPATLGEGCGGEEDRSATHGVLSQDAGGAILQATSFQQLQRAPAGPPLDLVIEFRRLLI